MNIECTVEDTELPGDYVLIPSLRIACTRCGHVTESFGQHQRSLRRCLALLREECPKGEQNHYTAPYGDYLPE
jgi:hypothetical protein